MPTGDILKGITAIVSIRAHPVYGASNLNEVEASLSAHSGFFGKCGPEAKLCPEGVLAAEAHVLHSKSKAFLREQEEYAFLDGVLQ